MNTHNENDPALETVVLLHGMGRSRASMWPLAQRLRGAGFQTRNFPYSPAFHRFDTLVGDLHDFIVERVKTPRYHLVGHSLGNILIRARFRVGYPSGLTIMSSTLGCKTLSIWNDYYNRKFFWNAVPPDVRGTTYFVDVTTGLKADYLAQRAQALLAGAPMPDRPATPKRTGPMPKKQQPIIPPTPAEGSPSVTVACVYKTGGDFAAEYAHKLAAAVRRHSSFQIDFLCLTDDENLKGDFRTIPLINNWDGWWSKIELFRPGLTEADRILYFDLDTLILRNIDHLLCLQASFAALTPWNPVNRAKKQLASGILLWDHRLYSEYLYNGFQDHNDYAGDQAYISDALNSRGYQWVPLQTVARIYSYKRQCRQRLPKDAEIVCFHGKPRPHEMKLNWVKENWRNASG